MPLAEIELLARGIREHPHDIAQVGTGQARDLTAVLVLGRHVDGLAAELFDLHARSTKICSDLDDPALRSHALGCRYTHAQRGGVAKEVVSEARDQLRRRHDSDEMPGPTLFHEGRSNADIQCGGLHEVLAQRGNKVWRHVVEVGLDDGDPRLALDPFSDPHSERVPRSLAATDAIS